MRVAFFNGLVGFSATVIVGIRVLGMTLGQILIVWIISLMAGLISLFSTLAAERNHWLKTQILRGSLLTWGFLVVVYFGILLALAPQMRNVDHLVWLSVPLIAGQGWAIMLFGPIQDRIVRRSQTKSHLTF
ncbi:MAG: hypothetical protein AABZ55_03055 [Bdellovibrionota bacterium]